MTAPTKFASFALALLASFASANDGAARQIGGTVELIKGDHASIRMVEEVVRIDRLPAGRVRARFVFKNDGPATEVLIGFPAGSGGVDTSPADATLQQFRSWVDGKRVAVKRMPAPNRGEEDYDAWYTKRVRFAAGQTRVIEDSYVGGGFENSSGFRGFSYVVATGASWHGSVGRARILVDLSGLEAYYPYNISPAGYRLSGNRLEWDLRDFEPTAESNVSIEWFPAFRNITLNGRPIGVAERDTPSAFYFQALTGNRPMAVRMLARRRGDDVDVPATLIAEWLKLDLRLVRPGHFQFSRGDRWVEFVPSSRMLLNSEGRRSLMPIAVSDPVVKGVLYVRSVDVGAKVHVLCIGAVVKALGGQARFDRTAKRLDLVLQ